MSGVFEFNVSSANAKVIKMNPARHYLPVTDTIEINGRYLEEHRDRHNRRIIFHFIGYDRRSRSDRRHPRKIDVRV